MKKKYTALFLVLSLILSLALTACGDTATGTPVSSGGQTTQGTDEGGESEWETLNLTYATSMTEANTGTKNMHVLQDKINEKMDGSIQFEYFYNGSLVGAAETLDAVINGVVDMGYIQIAVYPSRFPISEMLERVGVGFNDAQGNTRAYRELMETLNPDEIQDFHVMMYSCVAMGAFGSTTPVTSMEDLVGKQVRTSGPSAEAIAAWGGVPVSIDWGETYESMRNGLFDIIYTNAGSLPLQNWSDICPYMTVAPFFNSCNLFIINQDVYDSMPDDQRAKFDELCNEVWEEYTTTYLWDFTTDANSIEFFKSVKEVTFLEDEESEKFLDTAGYLIEDFAVEVDERGQPGTEALTLWKELAVKYNEIYDGSRVKYDFFRHIPGSDQYDPPA